MNTTASTDKSTAEVAKEKAAETAETVSAKAREAASDLKEQATRVAHDAAETAKREAYARGESVRDTAADEIGNVGHALRKAADEMRNGSPQERTIGYLASTLADASDSVREKDLAEMVDDVTGFARRNPLLFVTGAALLGFAASRFGKASYRPALAAPEEGTQFANAGRARATTPATPVTPGTPYPGGSRPATTTGAN